MRRNWAMANEALSFSRISVVESVMLSDKISLFRPSENCKSKKNANHKLKTSAC